MSSRSRADRLPRRGFSLMEAMVSLIILVIVMVVVLSLLFSMKSFAEKQQAFTAPRQTARRALDYVSSTLAGAGDWNQVQSTAALTTPGNPYAVVTFFEWGNSAAATARRQASWNNLTGNETLNAKFTVNPAAPVASKVESTKFGSLGTDVISVAYPSAQVSPIRIPITLWGGGTTAGSTDVDVFLDFSAGCGGAAKDDAANLAAFKPLVGQWTESGGKIVSSTLIIADGNGAWRLVQLDDLGNSAKLTSNCAQQRSLSTGGNGQIVHATLKAPTVDQYYAPGGWRADVLSNASVLIAGIDFVSFRHRTVLDTTDPAATRVIGQLEQKSSGVNPATGKYAPGFFDPTIDNDTAKTTFTPIVDNVDDFQVAYILQDGSIWNTAGNVFDNGGTRVPLQAQTPAAPGNPAVSCNSPTLSGNNLDAACIVGLRVNVVGRSLPLSFGSRTMSEAAGRRRPAVEDHPVSTVNDTLDSGIYDRLRLTTTVMLRNRALGY
jgi:type II secretory pathway pseudopilin PulG